MENQLAKTESGAPAVRPAMAEGLEAMATARICDVPGIELDSVLMSAVRSAFRARRQEISGDDMEFIVEELAPAVLRACPYIRIGEIPIAIRDGVFGEYGEYFGLNTVTLTSFVKSRYASQKRTEAARLLNPPEPPPKPPPSEAELLAEDRKLLARAFGVYKETGHYEDHGNYAYRVAAKKLKLFSLSDERQAAYLEQGKKRAIAHFRNEMAKRPSAHREMSKNIADAERMARGTDGLARVHREALQLALDGWFAELAETGMEVTELMEG